MKTLVTIIALALAININAQTKTAKQKSTTQKTVAPKTTIRSVKMQDVVNIIDSSTHPIIVNFWATWCPPCVEEIPYFESITKEYAKDSVELILVSLDFADDYKKGKIDAFAKRQGYTSRILWLSETNADIICPMIDAKWDGNIPASLMVNNKTNYRAFFGMQLREERFKMEVEKLVK